MIKHSSKFSSFILRVFLGREEYLEKAGDLEEAYPQMVTRIGPVQARIWFWFQVLKMMPIFICSTICWRFMMFRNYLKTALRVMQRSKGFTLINVFGLAIGMACVIIIALYIHDELKYDRHHANAHRICRLESDGAYGGPIGQGPLGPLFQEQIPEIEACTRIYATRVWRTKVLISHEDRHFFSDNLLMVDDAFFDIFNVTFIRGSAASVFTDLNSIVITEAMARRYFGEADPMGRIMSYDHRIDYRVTGVVESIPRQSHFHVDFLIPLENYGVIKNYPPNLSSWSNSAFFTYFLLSEGADAKTAEAKLAGAAEKTIPPNRIDTYRLRPLTRIHLYSHAFYELETNGDIRLVWIFSAVAVVVLIIACANYVNLSTARSLKRVREIGMRKVVGAGRGQLIVQFLGEAVLIGFFALALAWCFVFVARPLDSMIGGGPLSLSPLLRVQGLFIMIGLTLFTGLAAGSIPAFAVSSFRPKSILTGRLQIGQSGIHVFRRVLVVLQFTISIGLMICSLIIVGQMDFIRRTPLGFDMDQIVVVPTNRNPEAARSVVAVKTAFQNIAGVRDVTISSHTPGKRQFYRRFHVPGTPSEKRGISIMSLWTDFDFARTYRLQFLAGRDFSAEMPTDRSSSVILNASAIRQAGFEFPEAAVGRRVECNGKEVTVIGVVKDFHFSSLHRVMEPIIMWYDEGRFFDISVRIHAVDARGVLNRLKEAWHSVLPDVPFELFSLDARYAGQYTSEARLTRFLTTFTLLAVLVSCMGMVGLAAFSAERRIKEIGIRKVLGASAAGMVALLSRQFLRWVLLANVLAWPTAWFAMTRWLQTFSYRISISWVPFVASAAFAVLFALAAVGFHAVKTAVANPVESLRYE